MTYKLNDLSGYMDLPIHDDVLPTVLAENERLRKNEDFLRRHGEQSQCCGAPVKRVTYCKSCGNDCDVSPPSTYAPGRVEETPGASFTDYEP